MRVSIENRGGRILGQVNQAGLFLAEDGAVRPLFELDLQATGQAQRLQEPGLSPELQVAIDNLWGIIARRRRQLAKLASMQLRKKYRKSK